MPTKTMIDESHRPTKTVTLAHEDISLVKNGLSSLRRIPGMAVWEVDETRTTMVENGVTDEIHVDGVESYGAVAARVAIDYDHDPPRVIVHGDPENEEPTDVVSLESTDEE
jgi:hypothetical protein